MDLLTDVVAEVLREFGVETESGPVLVATVPTQRGSVQGRLTLLRRGLSP